MNIGVTSKNALKVQAVKKVYNSFGIQANVVGYTTNSLVGEQPVEQETAEGAQNRIVDLKTQNVFLDKIVSIESGIFYEHHQWVDKAVVIIEDVCSSKQYIGYSKGVVFPDIYVQQAQLRGFATTTVAQVMAEEGYTQYAKDPHFSITGVSRQTYIEDVLQTVIENSERASQST